MKRITMTWRWSPRRRRTSSQTRAPSTLASQDSSGEYAIPVAAVVSGSWTVPLFF